LEINPEIMITNFGSLAWSVGEMGSPSRQARPGKEEMMKTLDRLIFLAIAIFLGILAAKAFMPVPGRATTGEVIDVNLVEIGGQRVWRDQFINTTPTP